ncbi:MAG: HAMP domain-containing sensor histidine kinase [Acidobacteriota bacterium]|nr:HAMP domain-containing sensor histidine kinase [Acidobacteriota bacterium]
MVYGTNQPKGMFLKGGRVSAVTVLVGLVMLLVPALAYMQYQWLGQLSTAERERMQRTLRTAAAQFATEFDTELSRALVGLQVDGATIRDENWTGYAQRYSAWTNSAAEPRLVREVLLVDTLPGTELPAIGSQEAVPIERLRVRRWNAQTLAFDAAEWTDDLATIRASLATHFIGFQVERTRSTGGPNSSAPGEHRREGSISLSLGDDNTLVSPVTLFELPDNRRGPPKITILGFTVVRLDPVVVRDTLLASLAARHFHGDDDGVDYRVAVVHRDEVTNVVWESEPGVAERIADSPDVSQNFMAPRPDQMFVFARGGSASGPPPPPPPAPPAGGSAPPRLAGENAAKVVVSMVERETRAAGGGRVITRSAFNPFDGRWVLLAKHRAGSLEAAVAAVRQRNLLVSSSVLLLLTMAIGLIVVSARRAQELARQQMEFVAAVSHELRTPVSVIGAAAGNLADGVVGDPARVRKYGETIQGEARRLAETVERVLQLAGIAAGRAAAAPLPVSPSDLIHDSIGACRNEIENAGVQVETAVAPDLPPVLGDVTALRSALQNLISNAVKYGGEARWLRVSASRGSGFRDQGAGGKNVVFTVEDHGLGIDADDRKHIFEPFYRGREAVSKQIQGSGLGLNLVARIAEAHGGKVNVTSEPGKGSVFTLTLPAVTDRAAAESQAFATGLETSRS